MDELKCPSCGTALQQEMPLSEYWYCPDDLSVWEKDVMLVVEGNTTVRKIYLVEQKRKYKSREDHP